MNLYNKLRLRSVVQTRDEILLKRYAGSYPTVASEKARYLQITLTTEYMETAEALLDVDEWLQTTDINLPGIPWFQVPLHYILNWMNSLDIVFSLEGVRWRAKDIKLPTGPLKKMISIPAQPCSLLCSDWPDYKLSEQKGIEQETIPFHLQFILGSSWVPLLEMNNIERGDLLIIKNHEPVLSINWKKLFFFDFLEDGEVTVDKFFNDSEENLIGEEETLLNWTQLPVNVDFVLDKQVLYLKDIDNIKPGMVLRLNHDAEQNIKIFLNRKLFAEGELVALEQGGLAVEVKSINSGTTNNMGSLDVKQ